jgi:hypothetical protein
MTMKERIRLHREEPSRTAPIRDFSSLYRRPGESNDRGSPTMDASQPDPPDLGEATRSTSDSVAAAYRLIRKHVEEGRQAAAQLSNSPSSARSVSDPLQQLGERIVSLQGEILPLLMDVLRSLVKAVPATDADAPRKEGKASADGEPYARSLVLDLVCRRPLEVAVEIPQHSANLVTPGLHALDGNKPALKAVSFLTDDGDGRMRLRIVVPEDQEAGVYSGVIVDRTSGELRGTLTVRIKD